MKILREYSKGLYSSYEYQSDANAATLDIEVGVLLLMAFWSGPAVMGFQRICESLQRLDLPDGFRFRVLDIDGGGDLISELAKHEVWIGGSAEGYWFRDGEIFASTAVSSATKERVEALIGEMT